MRINVESKLNIGDVVAHKNNRTISSYGDNIGIVTGINIFVSMSGDHRLECEIDYENMERQDDLIKIELDDNLTIK